MRTIIYWFSGTGNSFHVAKSLQDNLDDVELIPVTKALNGDIEIASKTGLVFPVYAWGPPVAVSKLIERLPSNKPDYLFAAVTYGTSPGTTIAITRKMLKNRGLQLNAGFSVRMVKNYPPFGGAPKEQEQRKINSAAETGIEKIVAGVRDGKCGDLSKSNFFMSFVGHLVYPIFKAGLSKQKNSKFYADDKCTSCGICEKVCPVLNVQLADGGRPTWGNHCEQCFACFHWCPENAVQYGKKTSNQVRYHHPDTKLSDMTLN